MQRRLQRQQSNGSGDDRPQQFASLGAIGSGGTSGGKSSTFGGSYEGGKKKQHQESSTYRISQPQPQQQEDHQRLSRSSAASPAARRRLNAKSAQNDSGDALDLAKLPGVNKFAERALMGLLKAFARIHRDRAIAKWKSDPRLLGMKGGGRESEYDLELAIGVSAGWAIEGAIGSSQKIDATYLSPHVNNAARMMAANAQYGTRVLVHEQFQALCGESCKANLRHIDSVMVKGSSVPVKVYAFDCTEKAPFFFHGKGEERANEEAEAFSEDTWSEDKDIQCMR